MEPWDDTDTKFATRQRIWHSGRNQQTRRHLEKPPQFRKEKKAVKPFIGLPDKPTDQWMCHAGEQPWPHYWSHPPEDAFRSLWVLEGEGEWEDRVWYGIRRFFAWLEGRAYKMHVRVLLSRYRSYDTCPACDGARLKDTALALCTKRASLTA